MTNLYVICTRIHLCAYQWYAPPGIPGADVGERRGIIFPNGLVLSPNPLKLHIYSLLLSLEIYIFWNFSDTHISLSHTVHNREIWGICKGVVYACRIVPEVWGLVPIGHVNSPTKPRYWRYRVYH